MAILPAPILRLPLGDLTARIGGTPLVPVLGLEGIPEGVTVLGKCEWLNPGALAHIPGSKSFAVIGRSSEFAQAASRGWPPGGG